MKNIYISLILWMLYCKEIILYRITDDKLAFCFAGFYLIVASIYTYQALKKKPKIKQWNHVTKRFEDNAAYNNDNSD